MGAPRVGGLGGRPEPPMGEARDRGAPRLRRGGPNVGGLGGRPEPPMGEARDRGAPRLRRGGPNVGGGFAHETPLAQKIRRLPKNEMGYCDSVRPRLSYASHVV